MEKKKETYPILEDRSSRNIPSPEARTAEEQRQFHHLLEFDRAEFSMSFDWSAEISML